MSLFPYWSYSDEPSLRAAREAFDAACETGVMTVIDAAWRHYLALLQKKMQAARTRAEHMGAV